MYSKNMRRALRISGRILGIVSFMILSLSSPHQATTGSRVRQVPDWCSTTYCQDCARSEVSGCSNGAASNPSGDLCGCCHSCVQIRDFGASCGSQLAVRFASDNFGNSRSRFTVLASASCRPGLVCINFTCERSEDAVDQVGAAPVERKGERTGVKSEDSEEPDDLRTNIITVENSHEFYYRHPDYYNVDDSPLDTDDAFTTRETDPEKSTSIPWPISLTTGMLPTTGREVSEAAEFRRPNNVFDSSVHLVNVELAGREFQLIHGRDALADLKLLLQSISKSHSTSILNDFQALLLYKRFKDVLDLINKVIDPESGVSVTVDSQEHFETENPLVGTVRNSGDLGAPRKFTSSRSLKLPKPRMSQRFQSIFRRKRELEDSLEGDPKSQYSEVVIYDFLNDTPRTIMDPSRRWFIAREVETTSEERSSPDRLLDPDFADSTISIHITGMPGTTKSASEFELVEEENNDEIIADSSQTHDNYDDKLEIFVSDATGEFPNFSEANESLGESANFTTSSMLESYGSFESQSGGVENTTRNDWETSRPTGEDSGYFGTYEFTFPESPVILEDDYDALALRVNETVDEFRTQLNRIETKIVVIESSLYNMLTKIGTKERSAGKANEELGYTIESDDSPASFSNSTGRFRGSQRIPLPKKRGTHFSRKNSTYVYLGPSRYSGNDGSFKLEDEGVSQLIPIRSNRRWRTASWQPGQAEARKVLESRGRLYPNRIEGDDFIPRRKKPSRRRASDLIARRSGAKKIIKEVSTRSPGKIQSPRFLSSIDTRSSTRIPADIFSREEYGLRATPLRSTQQVFWPLNSARRSPVSTERTKRKSSGLDSRGRISKSEQAPLDQESVLMLETQIPKPLRVRGFKNFDSSAEITPTRFAMLPMEDPLRRSFDVEDDWDWSSWEDGPLLDLFVVNDESKSEFAGEVSRSRESPTIILPMGNENPEILGESWETAYPSYPDYSERPRVDEEAEKEESPIGEKTTQASTNLRRARRISAEAGERVKRAADFSQAGQSNEVLVSRSKKGSPDKRSKGESPSGPRQKRSVQMADWLRAAQEYHERLRQVRTAALGTWLASREQLDEANLTDVKLFTREIPSYLEKYRPSSTAENDSIPPGEASHVFPVEDPRNQPSSITDDELFVEFLRNQSSSSRNESKTWGNDRSDRDPSGEMSSSSARKFTIIATGNSTIRIEELPESDVEIEESLLDQSAQGSISIDRRTASGESEEFDHMYEGVDAEDGDFDYGDPNFALSRWLDEVDIIDASSVEIPVDKVESTIDDDSKDEDDYEVDELLSRSKRDSPLFLFRVNGDPGQEVLVWPANWKDYIDKHFRRNRTGNSAQRNSPQRTTKRTRPRISKLVRARKTVPETGMKNSRERDNGISSSEERSNDEEAEKDSSVDLALARRFEDSFDNRPRQNKRKNIYRSNIGSYQ